MLLWHVNPLIWRVLVKWVSVNQILGLRSRGSQREAREGGSMQGLHDAQPRFTVQK